MVDKRLLFKYHQYVRELDDDNSDSEVDSCRKFMSFNEWSRNTGCALEGGGEGYIPPSKEEQLESIIQSKNKNESIKQIYDFFMEHYNDNNEYNDIL